MRLRTQPHIKNEVILVDVVLTRLIFNAYNYINLEASGPRLRLISYMCIPNGAQILWKRLQISAEIEQVQRGQSRDLQLATQIDYICIEI